jgi:hypothetical protein
MVLYGVDVGKFSQIYELIKKRIDNDQLNIVVEIVEEKQLIIAQEKFIPKTLKSFKGALSVHLVLR